MRYHKKSVLCTFAIILSFFIQAFFTSDVMALAVGIDKPHVNVVTPPGGASSNTIIVKNKGDTPITIETNVEDWVYGLDGKREFRPAGSTPLSCATWIEVSPQSAVIPPHENRPFNFTLRAPESAVGGHYAAIFFTASGGEMEDEKGMQVRLMGRIGSIIFQETEGRVNRMGTIPVFNISKPDNNNPLIVKYVFKNEGNVFIKGKSNLSILDKKGNVIGRADSENEFGTLPQDVREDTIKWFGSLPKGSYDLVLTVDIGEQSPPVVKQESIIIEKDVS